METNLNKILGIILLWAIFIGNTNIDLSDWENILVGLAAWLILSRGDGRIMCSTYYLEKGDEVPCMRCEKKLILEYEPAKCCKSKQDSAFNMCGCQGAPEPIFCEECWEELKE